MNGMLYSDLICPNKAQLNPQYLVMGFGNI